MISSEGEVILQGLQGNTKMMQIIGRDAESRLKHHIVAELSLRNPGMEGHAGDDAQRRGEERPKVCDLEGMLQKIVRQVRVFVPPIGLFRLDEPQACELASAAVGQRIEKRRIGGETRPR
jgi:hypothetical protein